MLKKVIKTILITFIIVLVLFAGYLVNRYLIPKEDFSISDFESEKTEEEFEITDNSYISNDLKIQIQKVEEGEGDKKITYFIADVKLTDFSRLKRAFANDKIGQNITEEMHNMVNRTNAILAINGDYYGFRKDGYVIGDGNIYREVPKREGLAIYNDGTMKIFDERKTTGKKLIEEGVTSVLSFGPVLVRNGKAEADYTNYSVDEDNLIRANIANPNPRTGVGYYEKGHFCFIVVDGRNVGYSRGVTFPEFAKIFENLGCKIAYNLDGGNSSNMYFMGKKVNVSSQPGNGERDISDMLYVY